MPHLDGETGPLSDAEQVELRAKADLYISRGLEASRYELILRLLNTLDGVKREVNNHRRIAEPRIEARALAIAIHWGGSSIDPAAQDRSFADKATINRTFKGAYELARTMEEFAQGARVCTKCGGDGVQENHGVLCPMCKGTGRTLNATSPSTPR